MDRLDDPESIWSRSGVKLAMWILGALFATAAFGYAIGAAGAEKGTSFNWETGAVAATAFATTVLAAFTGTLAAATLIERKRQDRVLVAVRLAVPHQQHQGGSISYDVILRNVGTAPANYITLKVESEDSAGVPLVGRSTNDHFLRTGEETTITVELAIAPRRSLPGDIQTRVRGQCLNSASGPEYFVWQRYQWGGTSFLFKTKPWALSDVQPKASEET
jgi:hypothetical protein